jgi:5-methylcytosine-specific restriction endonuclease McrA
MREYQEKNRQRLADGKRAWFKSHKGVKLAIQRARRAKAKSGDFTAEEWEAMKRDCQYRCRACSRREPDIKLEADHIVPLKLGGEHTASNIQPLCRQCNASKGARLMMACHDIAITEVEA